MWRVYILRTHFNKKKFISWARNHQEKQLYGYLQNTELFCLKVRRKIPLVNNELTINCLKCKQVQGNGLYFMDFQIVAFWNLNRI